jgi:uncharacterized membrane protein YeaQ/YmgE (transglycosylase-associated protein family)
MGLIWGAIYGLIVGAIARFLYPGKEPGGWIVTILLGIAGGFVAGMVGRLLHFYAPGQGAGIVASVLGAILVLWIYNRMRAKT